MLPKKNRADTRAVERIFKQGKTLTSPNLNFRFVFGNSGPPRISVVVPKTVAKKAVARNNLRRRGYIVLGKYINKFPIGILGAFVFKKPEDSILILEYEIKNILNKIS